MVSGSKAIVSPHREIEVMRQSIDEHLAGLLPETNGQDIVSIAMREGAMAPGKRIRPLLMLLAARDLRYQGSMPTLLDLACAVELTHTASLMLDDMPCMDNAELRRGQPTTHKKFGESVAILASVGLLSKAFGLIAATGDLPGERRAQAVNELSTAVGVQGLVLGQFRDLNDTALDRTPDAILSTNHLKTGILFSAMLQIIAIAAASPESTRQTLHAFALDFGQAFQLLDDLRDDHPATGKDRNKDAGKSTLVNRLGADAARQKLREHIDSADRHLTFACPQGGAIRQFMHLWFGHHLADWSPVMKIA